MFEAVPVGSNRTPTKLEIPSCDQHTDRDVAFTSIPTGSHTIRNNPLGCITGIVDWRKRRKSEVRSWEVGSFRRAIGAILGQVAPKISFSFPTQVVNDEGT